MVRRIFIENIKLGRHLLSFENEKYLKKVLRLRENELIHVFDGKFLANARLISANSIEIFEIIKEELIEKNKILVVCGIKKERFEWMLEKVCEIGIHEIIVLKTERTQNEVNLRRANLVLIEAAKQSKRISIPLLNQLTFDEFIKNYKESNFVFCSLLAEKNILNQEIEGVIVGPEGGFSENEEKILSKYFKETKLSMNVLRTETAAICASFLIC